MQKRAAFSLGRGGDLTGNYMRKFENLKMQRCGVGALLGDVGGEGKRGPFLRRVVENSQPEKQKETKGKGERKRKGAQRFY